MKGQTFRTFLSAILAAACLAAMAGCENASPSSSPAEATAPAVQEEPAGSGPEITIQRAAATQAKPEAAEGKPTGEQAGGKAEEKAPEGEAGKSTATPSPTGRDRKSVV